MTIIECYASTNKETDFDLISDIYFENRSNSINCDEIEKLLRSRKLNLYEQDRDNHIIIPIVFVPPDNIVNYYDILKTRAIPTENYPFDGRFIYNKQQYSSPDSKHYPELPIVDLIITFKACNNSVCGKGGLINENLILKAGHCLYDSRYGGYAENIKIYLNKEFIGQVILGLTVKGWIGTKDVNYMQNHNCDYGLIFFKNTTPLTNFIGIEVKKI